jgi:hypothetical protein
METRELIRSLQQRLVNYFKENYDPEARTEVRSPDTDTDASVFSTERLIMRKSQCLRQGCLLRRLRSGKKKSRSSELEPA